MVAAKGEPDEPECDEDAIDLGAENGDEIFASDVAGAAMEERRFFHLFSVGDCRLSPSFLDIF